jgi:hypothetical protein
MKIIALGFLGVSLAAGAWAQRVDAPAVKSGDTWTYRVTTEKGTSGWNQIHEEVAVSRVTSSSIYYTSKPSGSTQPARESFAGLDWSRMRDVNGKETVVNRPLAFPLTAGKTWDVQYTEEHPNRAHRSEQWNNTFKVVGYETVEVPAGKFNSLKVEAEGHWTAEPEPTRTIVQGAQSTADAAAMVTQVQKARTEPATGRTYKAFWYVPEVRRWVKSVEEYYGSGGVRNERFTMELESFKVSE